MCTMAQRTGEGSICPGHSIRRIPRAINRTRPTPARSSPDTASPLIPRQVSILLSQVSILLSRGSIRPNQGSIRPNQGNTLPHTENTPNTGNILAMGSIPNIRRRRSGSLARVFGSPAA
jgi:hypothetical protein